MPRPADLGRFGQSLARRPTGAPPLCREATEAHRMMLTLAAALALVQVPAAISRDPANCQKLYARQLREAENCVAVPLLGPGMPEFDRLTRACNAIVAASAAQGVPVRAAVVEVNGGLYHCTKTFQVYLPKTPQAAGSR